MSRLDFLPLRKALHAVQIFVKLVSMEELSVISLMYEIHKKLVILNTAIDKKYRHTLSEPCVQSCARVLELLVLAKYAPKPLKASYLVKANSLAELTALQLRTMLELKLANETNILKLQARLIEARKQINGWYRATP